ncbi:MAG: hypothetical protein JWO22_1238, partial [Frankiales bacterium]|nr:hypothetical protein [Frankiales bacterium]
AASAGGLSVQPAWDHERGRPGKPQATSRVTARLPDIAAAGAVVTAALEAGGKDVRLESLTPVVTDAVAALRDARQRAFGDARTAAQQYAELAGLRLGACLQVQEGGLPGAGTWGRKSMATMGGAVDVPQGPLDVSASVTVTWELAD